jgi:hypothetical protein
MKPLQALPQAAIFWLFLQSRSKDRSLWQLLHVPTFAVRRALFADAAVRPLRHAPGNHLRPAQAPVGAGLLAKLLTVSRPMKP